MEEQKVSEANSRAEFADRSAASSTGTCRTVYITGDCLNAEDYFGPITSAAQIYADQEGACSVLVKEVVIVHQIPTIQFTLRFSFQF